MLRAWASHSYLERTDGLDDSPPPPTDSKRIGDSGNADRKRTKGEFRGLLLSNQTHRFSSELEARLLKKAPSVCMFLIFMGYCVMENRNGLVVASQVSQATGRAERDAAVNMARSLLGPHQKTLVAGKGYDIREFVAGLRISGITPHVVQNLSRSGGSAIDGRTTLASGLCPIDQRREVDRAGFCLDQTGA